MCQEFCVNGCFFLAPQAILGGGKVGILVLDFHFSRAHSFSCFWPQFLIGWLGFGPLELDGDSRSQRSISPSRFTPAHPAEDGRPAGSRNAAARLSSSVPAWSTFWLCAPVPEIVASAPLPDSGTILGS